MRQDREFFEAALAGYRRQREQLDEKIAEVEAHLGVAAPAPAKRRRGRPRLQKPAEPVRTGRNMSDAGRDRISEAARRRWAEFHARQTAGVL